MNDCLFCKMIAGEIPCDIVYENESVFAFRDIDPKAPTHILLIPRKHFRSINDLGEPEQTLAGELLVTAKKIAMDDGIDEYGFRTIFNTNSDRGQTVFHIHMHILGGRKMAWPPG